MSVPRLLDQPQDWLRDHPDAARGILRWIIDVLGDPDEELEGIEVEDARGRPANVSSYLDTDVRVTWRMHPSGAITVTHIGELPA